MRARRLVWAALVLAALTAAPAAGLGTTTSGDRWGCVAVDGLGGLCLSSPLEGLGL